MAAENKETVDDIQVESAPQVQNDKGASVSADANNDLVKKFAGQKGAAAEFLKQIEQPIVVTPEDNKRVLRKIDWRILPIILFVYCLQSLDKTTLSYASVFGLIKDTNLVGDQFSWLGSVVYVAQLVFQPLIAYFLVKFPIGKFSATMVFLWGAVLCKRHIHRQQLHVLTSFQAAWPPAITLPALW